MGSRGVLSRTRSLRLVLITSGMTPIIESLSKSPHDVVGIVQSRPRRKEGVRGRLQNRLIRCYLRCRALSTGKVTLKGHCSNRHISYFFMRNGSDDAFRRWIQSLSPDLVLVYSMAELLPRDIFEIPQLGTINLHPSVLPAYRGPDPLFWQYVLFDRKHGATIHYIDSGEDTGAILAQQAVHIPLGYPMSSTRKDVLEVGLSLLREALVDIVDGTSRPKKQPKESPTPRARLVRKSEAPRLVDWSRLSVEHAWHLLAGLSDPYPLLPRSSRLDFLSSYVADSFEHGSLNGRTPGTIFRNDRGLCVVCQDGFVQLRRVLSGKMLLRRWLT